MHRDGVKVVSPDNWLKADGAASVWVKVNMRTGATRPTTGEDWIEDVNQIALSSAVPDEIRALFEFAKGALGYGYFYYPLFTLVTQQLLRVADIAVDVLFERLNITPKPQSLDRRIVILREHWLIDDEQYFLLDMMRIMRNRATHESSREIMMPVQALRDIRWIAEIISGLPWPNSAGSAAP